MAAFSSLALLGLGLAGGMAASKVLGRRRQPAQAPSEIQAPATRADLAPAPPPSTTQASSDATRQAQQAAVRQRRRAAGAGTGLPMSRRSGRRGPAARLEPLTLGTGILGG